MTGCRARRLRASALALALAIAVAAAAARRARALAGAAGRRRSCGAGAARGVACWPSCCSCSRRVGTRRVDRPAAALASRARSCCRRAGRRHSSSARREGRAARLEALGSVRPARHARSPSTSSGTRTTTASSSRQGDRGAAPRPAARRSTGARRRWTRSTGALARGAALPRRGRAARLPRRSAPPARGLPPEHVARSQEVDDPRRSTTGGWSAPTTPVRYDADRGRPASFCPLHGGVGRGRRRRSAATTATACGAMRRGRRRLSSRAHRRTTRRQLDRYLELGRDVVVARRSARRDGASPSSRLFDDERYRPLLPVRGALLRSPSGSAARATPYAAVVASRPGCGRPAASATTSSRRPRRACRRSSAS